MITEIHAYWNHTKQITYIFMYIYIYNLKAFKKHTLDLMISFSDSFKYINFENNLSWKMFMFKGI